MSTKPIMPQAGSLPLPPEWLRFLSALLAYAASLEARIAALEPQP